VVEGSGCGDSGSADIGPPSREPFGGEVIYAGDIGARADVRVGVGHEPSPGAGKRQAGGCGGMIRGPPARRGSYPRRVTRTTTNLPQRHFRLTGRFQPIFRMTAAAASRSRSA
jgi:hypothetical protein